MDKIWPFLITSIVALIAVAIAYRTRILHNIVFGKGSAHLNEAAKHAAVTGAV